MVIRQVSRRLLHVPFLAGAAAMLLGLLLADPSRAQRGDFYIGGHLGIADVKVRSGGAFDQIVDGDENVLSYEMGYDFSPHIGIEAAYHDLSKVDGAILPCAQDVRCSEIETTTKFTALTLALTPRYPVTGRVSVFAKIGLVAWEGDVENAVENLDVDLDDLDQGDTLIGVGVQVGLISRLDAVTQWQSFGDIEIVSAGLRLTF